MTATLQSCFHPLNLAFADSLQQLSQARWDSWKLLGPVTPHIQWVTEICLNLAKDTSLLQSSSAYFSPCTKNVLARVKSDNSLKHQMFNNQKLIQDNLCVGTGSCEKSHIFLSMAVELCIKVSTPGCSHHGHWQTHIFSKYPVLVIYYCPMLEVPWLASYSNSCPSVPHWCATHAHSWLMYQERQTLVMKHQTQFKSF